MAEENIRRETERLRMHLAHSKGVTAQRPWGWDLHEMREAAMMDHSMLDDTADNSCPAPTVSGFTPINRYSDTAPSHPNHEDAAIKSKSADKARALKRRKTQPSASTSASRSKRAASSKKTTTIKAAARLGEDGFPIGDECFEEMMQSMPIPTGKECNEPLGSDRRPQDFSDDTSHVDEQLGNDQSHWPGVIQESDGVVVYDEDPRAVASNIDEVPSSPQRSSQASCILTHVTGNANPDRVILAEGSENCFDDNDLDDGLIDLMVDESKSLPVTYPMTPATPEKRPLSPKLQWLPPKTYTPARSSQIPVSLTDDPHLVPVNSNGDALPFMRPSFPKSIRDRSPVLGLTNRTVLRICFRIGEALNAAAVASRTNVDAIIELYARVVFSSREAGGGYKQFFQFGDLFTDKPPYLIGAYTFWKGVGLWDNDSKELVGEQGRGKMVRVLGRIKKKEPGQGQEPGVEMVVLSVWEVDWEDIGVAKGIACSKGG